MGILGCSFVVAIGFPIRGIVHDMVSHSIQDWFIGDDAIVEAGVPSEG